MISYQKSMFSSSPRRREIPEVNMKTTILLLLLAVSSALAQSLNLDKAPLLDAPGPGYRQDPQFAAGAAVFAAPQSRPAISMLEATTIADRELQARGFAGDYMLRTVTFVRAPRIGDSVYIAIISPLGSTSDGMHREFRIDMRGAVAFREEDTDLMKVER